MNGEPRKLELPKPTHAWYTAQADSEKEVDHFLSLGMEPYAVCVVPVPVPKIATAGGPVKPFVERTYFKLRVEFPKEVDNATVV